MVGRVGICCNYSGTSPYGHPNYVDSMLSWTLFIGPVHGVHNIINFTTVDIPQFLTLFASSVCSSSTQMSTLVRFYCKMVKITNLEIKVLKNIYAWNLVRSIESINILTTMLIFHFTVHFDKNSSELYICSELAEM